MDTLDPSVKTVWSLRFFIRFFVLSLVLLFIEYFLIRPNLNWDLPIGLLGGIMFLWAIMFSIVWPILMYRFWRYEIREKEIFIERGVLTRIKTTAPFQRIQHIDVQQNVIERILHISRLVVYTAGTRGADIVIPGLALEYAEYLRDLLKNYSPEDAV